MIQRLNFTANYEITALSFLRSNVRRKVEACIFSKAAAMYMVESICAAVYAIKDSRPR